MTCRNSTNFKVCTQCKTVKALSEFNKQTKSNDGLSYYCKQCDIERRKAYHHSKDGVLSVIYGHQKSKSKRRKHSPPNYTLDEFRMWAKSHDEFHQLFDAWVLSDYDKKMTPSADRLDDYKSYYFDNLQWMTWRDNNLKGHTDRKNGLNNKNSKAVVQMNLDGTFVAEYHSISHASRMMGGHYCAISACCLGKAKTHNGYRWMKSLGIPIHNNGVK